MRLHGPHLCTRKDQNPLLRRFLLPLSEPGRSKVSAKNKKRTNQSTTTTLSPAPLNEALKSSTDSMCLTPLASDFSAAGFAPSVDFSVAFSVLAPFCLVSSS